MELTINGEVHEVTAAADVPLLWVLRDELGLTGTKYGCGIGLCGACTVHIDGVAARACITPAAAVEGREIRTIEGLAAMADDGTIILHPVQQAFIDEQVPQCGWCMSGQVMAAASFLDQNPTPDDEAIVNAMSNNYCRCGCYVRIKRAVARAAAAETDATANVQEVVA